MKKSENSVVSRMLYGCADIYGGGAFVVISTFYTVFLTKALGMNPALAGIIPLIGKVWDAVTDPIMGNIADRTVSKYGAKRFWILVGCFASAVTYVLMWVNMGIDSAGGKFAFYALAYCLFSTGFTIVMVPYNGLLPDMIEDYTKRAQFSSMRMIFSTFGAILAGLIPSIMIKDNTDPGIYLTVALIFGVIFTVCIFLTFLGTWERQKPPVKTTISESFVQALTVYKSRSFRLFLAIFLFGQAAADFLTGLAVYYIDDVLNAYGGGRFTMLMGVILVAQFIGTILFSFVLNKFTKRAPVLIGAPIRIIATLAMFFFSHEGANFTVILILSFFIGLGMAGTSTTIYAILSDMADVDELITSVSRSSIVSSMATFARKIATGFSSAIIGFLLAMVGYDETLASSGARQSAATSHGIAMIYIFVPILLMLITLYFTVKFPMNKKEYDIVKKDIARRKGEDNSSAAEEEKKVIESVTGFSYENLWNSANADRL